MRVGGGTHTMALPWAWGSTWKSRQWLDLSELGLIVLMPWFQNNPLHYRVFGFG